MCTLTPLRSATLRRDCCRSARCTCTYGPPYCSWCSSVFMRPMSFPSSQRWTLKQGVLSRSSGRCSPTPIAGDACWRSELSGCQRRSADVVSGVKPRSKACAPVHTCTSSEAASYTVTMWPRRLRATLTARPPMPPPAIPMSSFSMFRKYGTHYCRGVRRWTNRASRMVRIMAFLRRRRVACRFPAQRLLYCLGMSIWAYRMYAL